MGVQTLKRSAFLATVFTVVLVVILPFVGGSGPSLADVINPSSTAVAASDSAAAQIIAAAPSATKVANAVTATTAAKVTPAAVGHVVEHVAQKPVPKPKPKVSASTSIAGMSAGSGPAAKDTIIRKKALAAKGQSCPGNVGGSTRSAPGIKSSKGVGGTTSSDLAAFAHKMNAVRVANCLKPIPLSNYKYDSCMEKRLFWIAEDPSTNPNSAWGHIGSKRSDGKPSVGCDGNLAGGSGNTGATVAQKWWDSLEHRASLYRPSYDSSTSHVCILFAMSHGGVPNEPSSFTRAAARWTSC
jgi:hypothetical protein